MAKRTSAVTQQERRHTTTDRQVLQIFTKRHSAGGEISNIAFHIGIGNILRAKGPVVDDGLELIHVLGALEAAHRGQLESGTPACILDGDGRIDRKSTRLNSS